MHPAISVVMAVYNEEVSLTQAIESILQQTYQNFEIIIVDDNSNDNSTNIIAAYAKNDTRITVIHNEINMGLAESLNIGIQHTKAEWIARMDGDDISLPQRFEKQMAYLQAHPDIDVLSTALIDMTPENEPFGKRSIPEQHNQLAWRTLWASPAFHGTIMMRKNKFLQSGGYKKGEILEDVELWSRMMQYARFAALPDYLYQYHRTRNEFDKIQDERKEATIKICQNFVSQVLDRPILPEEYLLLRQSVNIRPQATLSEEQIINTISMLQDIYFAMVHKGILDENDGIKDVQEDLTRRIINLSLQSNNFIYQHGKYILQRISYDSLVKNYWERSHLGILKWPFFALLNPGVARRAIISRQGKKKNAL